jgi:hypothetical protein
VLCLAEVTQAEFPSFPGDRHIVVDEAFDRAQTIAGKLAAAKDGPLPGGHRRCDDAVSCREHRVLASGERRRGGHLVLEVEGLDLGCRVPAGAGGLFEVLFGARLDEARSLGFSLRASRRRVAGTA